MLIRRLSGRGAPLTRGARLALKRRSSQPRAAEPDLEALYGSCCGDVAVWYVVVVVWCYVRPEWRGKQKETERRRNGEGTEKENGNVLAGPTSIPGETWSVRFVVLVTSVSVLRR